MSPSPSLAGAAPDLLAQIRQIQTRLDVIEQRLGITAVSEALPEPPPAPVPEAAPAVPAAPSLPDTAATTALLGKSLLGLALAYALRALTENGSLPVGAGVGLGLVYALAWLIWAARTPASETLTV